MKMAFPFPKNKELIRDIFNHWVNSAYWHLCEENEYYSKEKAWECYQQAHRIAQFYFTDEEPFEILKTLYKEYL